MTSSHSQDPLSSVSDRSFSSNSQRQAQTAWSSIASQSQPQSQQSSRRAPPPLSTSGNPSSRPGSSSHSPRHPWSPTNSSAPSATVIGAKTTVRASSISSLSSPFSPPPSGVQAPAGGGSSTSRSRTGTSGSSGQPPSTTASATQNGTAAAASTLRLARASPSVSLPSSSATPTATAAGQSGSLSKITIAQVFLLLSTIKEEEKDPAKWESQADQIRKLIDANGMEVFTKYFRRLLLANAAQIWSTGRTADTTGSYPILVSEIQKLSTDPNQADKISESIDGGDGEIFKDFDLSTFMDHFKMIPSIKVVLACAFKKANKSDLRTKADAILASNINNFLTSLRQAESLDELPSSVLAVTIDRFARYPPRSWNADAQHNLVRAITHRYQRFSTPVPMELGAALLLFDLLSPHNTLVRLLQQHTSSVTESLEKCKSMLELVELKDISYPEVAYALLFMAIAKADPPYDPSVFVSALRSHRGGQRLDWQDVVQAFDRDGIKVTQSQFKALYDALLPIARESETFDVQLLWGGEWRSAESQLSFAAAFASFMPEELDASQIPRLRAAFSLADFENAPDEVKARAEMVIRHPLVSLDATKAIFNMVFRSTDTYSHAQGLGVIENVINPHMDLFVASACAVPKPWGALQDQAMKQLVSPFFFKSVPNHQFVLYVLWRRDSQWLETRLMQFYHQDPYRGLLLIYDHAQEQGWQDALIGLNAELALDYAALAHGRSDFDLESWLQQITQATPGASLPMALMRFLRGRADDELASHRGVNPPATVPLAVRTVNSLLKYLGDSALPEEEQVQLQRACIQAYPRLINYGEGFDELIDANGKESNALPPEADARMQEHYKLMYSGENRVNVVIEALQKYKVSEDPSEQDLFACMIFGLFDEYNCFAEYPLEALATTAVLFGGIINYNLLSKIALKAALAMVLESVRDYSPAESMYKFGLQALLHFRDRLDEWKLFSERLLLVPGLRGTPIEEAASKVVNEADEDSDESHRLRGADGDPIDSFLAPDTSFPEFTCLSLDPPSQLDFYEDPGEDLRENVLFILNNVSERNLDSKLVDLKGRLQEQHFQWFAQYLVDQRIKTQSNYQPLYMQLLEMFDREELWSEVLRQSFASTFRMLNAESTMNAASERTLLKNLGGWIGSMTLAKDQPIKFRNISFKDLLIEGFDTRRLPVVIPFTCNVLHMAAKSTVFKLPCAWTLEILSILLELYHHAELKLQLKFEIEILCNALGLDDKKIKEIQPSDAIRSRPVQAEQILPSAMADGGDGFSELGLMSLNRRGANERFSSALVPELSDIAPQLRHNYSFGPASPGTEQRMRQILAQAVERAVSDIIGPVVERSMTIAAISTQQLISKDFATEPDEAKLQSAAHTQVKKLAGSLALVTCKEPLRTGISNNIRFLLSRELPDQALAEGAILMFINDNLDIVCGLIEKAAETASVSEIDAQLEEAIAVRKNGQYTEPQVSRWAYHIPEPYKPSPDGLNYDQLSIYEEFGKDIRSQTSNHLPTVSQDSVRQLPDVLQDQYSSMTGPTEPPLLSRPGVSQGPHQLPNQPQARTPQQMMNGYMDQDAVLERIRQILDELVEDGVRRAQALTGLDTPDTSVEEAVQRLRSLVFTSMHQGQIEQMITFAAEYIVTSLLPQNHMRQQTLDALARTLQYLCAASESVRRQVYPWIGSPNGPLRSPSFTAALLKSGLVDFRNIDIRIANRLLSHDTEALHYLDGLIDLILFNEPPTGLRADLTHSISALARWLSVEPDLAEALAINSKLEEETSLMDSPLAGQPMAKQAQALYVFDEWTRLFVNKADEQSLASFVHQLHRNSLLSSREESATFLRNCLQTAIAAFENEEANRFPSANINNAYERIDALAKLLVTVAVHHQQTNGIKKQDKSIYFESLLSILALSMALHYQHKGERFNNRAFFRLFSSIISESHVHSKNATSLQRTLFVAIGRSLKILQPSTFPAFAYQWLSLIAHPLLIPGLLRLPEKEGWEPYCQLLERHLQYVGKLVKPSKISQPTIGMFRGTVALLLVLHHDFPEFLVENHFRMLASIPHNCVQMRSLITSASTAAFPDHPDPFVDGLKVERFEDLHRAPVISANLSRILEEADIKAPLDEVLDGAADTSAGIDTVVSKILKENGPSSKAAVGAAQTDVLALSAVVLYCVLDAESRNKQDGLYFSANSIHTRVYEELADKLPPEACYFFLSAIADQLRFPNSHTVFFGYLLFYLWRAGQSDANAQDLRMQITRVLLERLLIHKPHPWGLIATTLEFLRNRVYQFWESPFVKSVPEIEHMFRSLFAQMGQGNRATA